MLQYAPQIDKKKKAKIIVVDTHYTLSVEDYRYFCSHVFLAGSNLGVIQTRLGIPKNV